MLKILVLILILLSLGCGGGGETEKAPYASGYGYLCRDYPQSIFCMYQGGGDKEPDLATCERVFQKALKLERPSWTADRDQFGVEDYWKSYADEVEQGTSYTADCDDFACTVAELLWKDGIRPDRISLVMTTIYDMNHLVCVAGDWMLCTLQKNVIALRDTDEYRLDSYMRLSEPGVWLVW